MAAPSQISIIIPTKNEAKNIARVLISIRKSSIKVQEIIIVDNHSTDNTLKIARKILKNYTRNPIAYTLVTKGPERSSQKNYGARKAKSNHLLFLDTDMEISQGLLRELQQLAAKNVQAVIIPEESIGHDFWGKAVALERNCYQNQPLLEAPRFLQKKLFLKLGGYDAKLIAAEDWDLLLRLKEKKISIRHSKKPLFHHEAIGLFANLKRKWYYSKYIHLYCQKQPQAFVQQSNFSYRFSIFWQNRQVLIKYPLHTMAFLFIKMLVYLYWSIMKLIQ